MVPSTLLIPYSGPVPREWLRRSAETWEAGGVRQVMVIGPKAESFQPPGGGLGWRLRSMDSPSQGSVWNALLEQVTTPVLLLLTGDAEVTIDPAGLQRLAELTAETQASLLYSNHFEDGPQGPVEHAVNPYQLGSLRDNFDFGLIQAVSLAALREARSRFGPLRESQWGAFYDLRLRLSAVSLPLHLPESLYRARKLDDRPTGQQIFDYVDPRYRAVQVELEEIVTDHLRRIGAHLIPSFAAVPAGSTRFPVEASVIIPVRNRVRTVADAVHSALSQETPFAANVIVVDNHSTDGTTELLCDLAARHARLLHIVPDRKDLGIGGCWNLAVASPQCGRVAVQLDSDDLYSGPDTLRLIVEKMNEGPYVMVVGSYRMVNFDLQDIPPGLIDHREWTRDNGRNNLLRVNGLGAPRAFLTEVLRAHPLPNVSYGEDYGIGARLSREYEIGRIFDPLYLCRRWEGNTDANLALAVKNQHDAYKDRLRTLEILARQQLNLNGGSQQP